MTRRNSVTDLMPYRTIQDGVVFTKYGQVVVGLELFLPPTMTLDKDIQESMWRNLHSALKLGVDETCLGRLYIHSSEAPASVISAKGNTTLSSENDLLHEMALRNEHLFSEMRSDGKIKTLRYFFTLTTVKYTKPRKRMTVFTPRQKAELVQQAKEKRQGMVDYFQRARFGVKEMDNQDVRMLIKNWWNPSMTQLENLRDPLPEDVEIYLTPEELKKNPAVVIPTVNQMLAGSSIINTSQESLVIGEHFVKTVSMSNRPISTQTGMINKVIDALAGENFWVVLDFYHDERNTVMQKLLERAKMLTAFNDESAGALRNPATKVQLEETDKTVMAMRQYAQDPFNVGLTVVLYDTSEKRLRSMGERAKTALGDMTGAVPRVGTVQNFRLLIEELPPFSGKPNHLCFKMLSYHSTNLLPMGGPWKGGKKGLPFLTRAKTMARVDILDKECASWNGVVFGQMGSGKSVHTQKIMSEFLARNGIVIILDLGYSYQTFTDMFGGSTVLMKPGETSINIFDLAEGLIEPDMDRIEFMIKVLGTMVRTHKSPKQTVEEAILRQCLFDTFRNRREEYRDPLDNQIKKRFMGALLEDYVDRLKEMTALGNVELDADQKAVRNDLVVRFQDWIGDSPKAQFVNRPTNIKIDNQLVYFEASGLDDNKELAEVALLMFNNMLFTVMEDPKLRGVPKCFIFEEAWKFITNDYTADALGRLSVTTRKFDAAMYTVLQELSVLARLEGLLNNTTFFWIGKTENQDESMRKYLKLNDAAIKEAGSIINRPGEYFEWMVYIRYFDRKEGGIVQSYNNPFFYWVTTSMGSDVAIRNKTIQAYGGHKTMALRALADGKLKEVSA
ncbi:VirB4 family type IV secretion system protein [Deinococcus roseus]|uniref:TraG P-loop domain-containing protein n=1 Tax=Deinococcus roseus TaxID=392414 RepID=A0ABQ2D9A8_9DEIO|nr:DUF87 domain-containing protein [Deinococcus roseus]GGJ48144.1 hypothetical protein GCM10008938_37720 [Deinococcus roseus]